MERVILHSDLNNFYASVECLYDTSLKQVPLAVCGSVQDRHGIVLAKNEIAKKLGVKTGEAIWQAQQKCKDLTIVPPHFERYAQYSKLVQEIYYRYTDQIEPFGMDECWLDVTGSVGLFGNGLDIAEDIRTCIKKELGLTVSIGVSFNKIFAKLGSDMKKPDAITQIDSTRFRQQIWQLPAADLLGVGPATKRKLKSRFIETIGDLAKSDPYMLEKMLGINGRYLWTFANGLDTSRVKTFQHETPIKSIGNSITCVEDLHTPFEVLQIFSELSQSVARRLRKHQLCACGVQISVRSKDLFTIEYQTQLDFITQNAREISQAAFSLFEKRYPFKQPIRSLGIRAISVVPANTPIQLCMAHPQHAREKINRLECTVEKIREKHGKKSIRLAMALSGLKMPHLNAADWVQMPSAMYK